MTISKARQNHRQESKESARSSIKLFVIPAKEMGRSDDAARLDQI
jgi:hypothetical protein